MMRTLPIVAFVLFASVTSVLALEIPRSASQDSRVRFVNYQPFNIRGRRHLAIIRTGRIRV